jgi:transmembrane sensor
MRASDETTAGPAPSRSRAEQTRLEAAAVWRMQLEADPATASTPGFAAWIADPDNRRALARLGAAWRIVDEHSVTPEMIGLRRAALADAERASMRRSRAAGWRPRRLAAGALAAGVLVGVGLAAYPPTTTYATAIGERRTVVLSDGSKLFLDSDSRVSVRYMRQARRLVLRRGRCRFDVAHNAERPFTVVAGGEKVVAVGTSFDVERLSDKVLVTMLAGKVTVGPAPSILAALKAPGGLAGGPGAGHPAVPVTAGEQLVVLGDGAPAVSRADVEVATAWEHGRLEFDDVPLAEAVERMNRYTAKPIELAPGIGDLKISGAFDAGDVTAFVDSVTSYFRLAASVDHDRITLRPAG